MTVDADPTLPNSRVMWRIRATVVDRPRQLATICNNLAELDGNVASLQIHPWGDQVVDDFLLSTPPRVSEAQLRAAITAADGQDVRIDTADTHELVDVPTWVLMLAARTAADTALLPSALSAMLGGCEISWSSAGSDTASLVDDGIDTTAEHVQDTTMYLDHPDGGSLVLSRPGLAFTPAEFARARTLLDLTENLACRY